MNQVRMNSRTAREARLGEEGWRTLGEGEEIAFAQALDSDVRRAILKFLSIAPMSPIELTRLVSGAFEKEHRDSLVYYHLKLLEDAGLIGYVDGGTGARAIYRRVDHRVQYRPRPRPEGAVEGVGRPSGGKNVSN